MNVEKLEKLEKLQKEISNKKLKKVLKAAIKGWENTEACICFTGLYTCDPPNFSNHTGSCCLLGASLLNRKMHTPRTGADNFMLYNSWIYHGLSKEEMYLLTNTFDGDKYMIEELISKSKDKTKAKNFAEEVSKIREVVFENES